MINKIGVAKQDLIFPLEHRCHLLYKVLNESVMMLLVNITAI